MHCFATVDHILILTLSNHCYEHCMLLVKFNEIFWFLIWDVNCLNNKPTAWNVMKWLLLVCHWACAIWHWLFTNVWRWTRYAQRCFFQVLCIYGRVICAGDFARCIEDSVIVLSSHSLVIVDKSAILTLTLQQYEGCSKSS